MQKMWRKIMNAPLSSLGKSPYLPKTGTGAGAFLVVPFKLFFYSLISFFECLTCFIKDYIVVMKVNLKWKGTTILTLNEPGMLSKIG